MPYFSCFSGVYIHSYLYIERICIQLFFFYNFFVLLLLLLSVFPPLHVHPSHPFLAKRKTVFLLRIQEITESTNKQKIFQNAILCCILSNGNGVVCTKDWTDMNMGIMRVILISWGAFVIKLHFYSNTLFSMEWNVECSAYTIFCYAITARGIITLSG